MKESWRTCPGCLWEREPDDFPFMGRPDIGRRSRLCVMCLHHKMRATYALAILRDAPPLRQPEPTPPLVCGHPLAARTIRLSCWACEVAA